jgi:hypothetical protein
MLFGLLDRRQREKLGLRDKTTECMSSQNGAKPAKSVSPQDLSREKRLAFRLPIVPRMSVTNAQTAPKPTTWKLTLAFVDSKSLAISSSDGSPPAVTSDAKVNVQYVSLLLVGAMVSSGRNER